MRPLHIKDDIRINDRFFLGGPLTLRGFNLKGVGPHSDGEWCIGTHRLGTPFPQGCRRCEDMHAVGVCDHWLAPVHFQNCFVLVKFGVACVTGSVGLHIFCLLLLITFIEHCSSLSSRLTALLLHVTLNQWLQRALNTHLSGVVATLFGSYMTGAIWNCCHLGTFCGHHTTMQYITSLHAKLHT